ncbi:30S ribosomal protein S8e [Candidatus Woesearchaeota archaeon]|jgi:small subunit ribosomal protein S8e|nr:30S ribosomal protein S8e [Candidatus Woesearchaeota archaeon]|tara:strand:+ start:318 stop:701 length:384 start_codon:yes stop_codon:yes gene_type:complete
MAISQLRSLRKPSGGRYKQQGRKEKSYELGREPAFTKLEKRRAKSIRTRGINRKVRLLSTDTANLYNPKTKKYEQTKIKAVAENPANRQFVRRNIMTKGTVIETEKGKARITSRPGQDGAVNAVLIS